MHERRASLKFSGLVGNSGQEFNQEKCRLIEDAPRSCRPRMPIFVKKEKSKSRKCGNAPVEIALEYTSRLANTFLIHCRLPGRTFEVHPIQRHQMGS